MGDCIHCGGNHLSKYCPAEYVLKMRERCTYCGSVNHPTNLCPRIADVNNETYRERLARLQRAADLRKVLVGKEGRKDGITWMVSIIHPNHQGGSKFYSERPGKDARQAAQSYFDDPPEDNKGSALARSDPDMTLIVVVDNENVAESRKAWKVTVFQPRKNPDGSFELIEFS